MEFIGEGKEPTIRTVPNFKEIRGIKVNHSQRHLIEGRRRSTKTTEWIIKTEKKAENTVHRNEEFGIIQKQIKSTNLVVIK